MYTPDLEFHVYDQKWGLHSLRLNAERARNYKYLLAQLPLGNDPKSRSIRELCEYWIEFERIRRSIILTTVVEALTAILRGEYKGNTVGIDWHA